MVVTDPLEVLCDTAHRRINVAVAQLRAAVAQWEPRPMPEGWVPTWRSY